MARYQNTKIIAEVAQGFEGNPYLANLLAKAAVRAGANAVKFQLVFADELCVKTYPYFDFFKSLEMPIKVWNEVSSYIKKNKCELYFDIFGPKSLSWAKKLDADGVKISTTDFNNSWLITNAVKSFSNVLISIGGVEPQEMDSLWDKLGDHTNKVTFMHGFQAEPTLVRDNHLLRLSKLKKKYSGINLGFMDHSLGSDELSLYLPILSLGFGLECIEKHISLDQLLEVEDHISAISPSKFNKMVQLIRQLESAIGSDNNRPTKKELEYNLRSGKVVVAAEDLKKHIRISDKDLLLKRVTTKPDPKYLRKFDQLVDKKLLCDVKKDEPFTMSTIK